MNFFYMDLQAGKLITGIVIFLYGPQPVPWGILDSVKLGPFTVSRDVTETSRGQRGKWERTGTKLEGPIRGEAHNRNEMCP